MRSIVQVCRSWSFSYTFQSREWFFELCISMDHLSTAIIHKIFGPEAPISFSNAIKNFIIPGQYNKDNAYWADLFTRVKSWIKKIEMDMIYLPIFKLWGYIYF